MNLSEFAHQREDAPIPCPHCGYDVRQNVVGYCPECGTGLRLQLVSMGRHHTMPRILTHLRISLITFTLALFTYKLVRVASVIQESRRIDQGAVILLSLYTSALLLGLLALLTMGAFRKSHFVISILYFGLVIFTPLDNMASKVIYGTVSLSVDTIGFFLGGAILLSVGAMGMVLEIICERIRQSGTVLSLHQG